MDLDTLTTALKGGNDLKGAAAMLEDGRPEGAAFTFAGGDGQLVVADANNGDPLIVAHFIRGELYNVVAPGDMGKGYARVEDTASLTKLTRQLPHMLQELMGQMPEADIPPAERASYTFETNMQDAGLRMSVADISDQAPIIRQRNKMTNGQ